ncbi:MAG: hypothetical protein MRECE_4c002 [Mycoplasmataceae bacterium CE_OT135]|nr:MAG: hypothetical protein MRECE_4c002 [Mycoplasmataceae bacterium CE_OT135]
MKKIYYFNEKKDNKLLRQALINTEQEILDFQFIRLEANEELYNQLCQLVSEQYEVVKSLGALSSHYGEVNPGAYRGEIYSLVIGWNYNQAGLLEIWAQFGSLLARAHCFTNGNKRTALLSMFAFLNACGFRLKDDNLPDKWEKILIDVVLAETEELAVELMKERILANIYV